MSEFATEIGRDIYVDIAGWHLVRQARALLLSALCVRQAPCLAPLVAAGPKSLRVFLRRALTTAFAHSTCAT